MAEGLAPVIAILDANIAAFKAKIDEAKAQMAELSTAGTAAAEGGISNVEGSAGSAAGALGGLKGGAEDAAGALGGLKGGAQDVSGALGDTQTELEKTQKSTEDTNTALKDTASRGSIVGDTLMKAGKWAALGVAGVGVAAVKSAADFQSAMAHLVTDAGESQKAIGGVRQGILSLAGKTAQTPTQLAQAMYYVESAGFHAAKGLVVLKAAAQGAAAGGTDATTVADALTSALNAYGLSANKSTQVTNEMIATVGAGKMKLADLASSLSAVLPVAAAAHVSFAQVGGAIATMTAQGVSAQQATQDLANTIRAMQSPNAVAVNEMQQLGINSNEVAMHLGKEGLTGTIGYLTQVITKNMGKSGEVIMNAFNQSKAAAGDLQIMLKSMPPSVQKLADSFMSGSINMSTFRKSIPTNDMGMLSQFTALYNKVHGFNSLLTSGQPAAQTYTAALSKMMGGATGLNTALLVTGSHAATFAHNVQTIGDAAKKGGHAVAGFGAISKTLSFRFDDLKARAESLLVQIGGALTPAVSKLAPVFGKLLTAIAPVISQLGGVLAHAVLSVLPLITMLAHTAIMPLTKALGPLISALSNLIPPLVATIAPVLKLAGSLLDQLMPIIAQLINQGILPLIKFLSPVLPIIAQLAYVVLEAAMPILRLTVSLLTLKPVIYAIGIGIMAAIGPIGLLAVAISELSTHWHTVWNSIKNVALTVWHFLYNNVFGPIVHFYEDVWGTEIRIALRLWEYAWEGIRAAALIVWHFLDNDVFRPLTHFFDNVWNSTLGLARRLWNDVWTGIKTDATTVWHIIDGDVLQPIVHFFQAVWHDQLTAAQRIWDAVWTHVSSVAKDVKKWILDAFADVGRWLENAGRDLIMGFIHGVEHMASSAVDAVKSVGHSVVNGLRDVWNWFSPAGITIQAGSDFVQGMAVGIAKNGQTAVTAAHNVAVQIINSANRALQDTPISVPVVDARKSMPHVAAQMINSVSASVQVGVQQVAKKVQTAVTQAVHQSATQAALKNAGSQIPGAIASGIASGTSGAIKAASTSAKSAAHAALNDAKNAVSEIGRGLLKGAKSLSTYVYTALSDINKGYSGKPVNKLVDNIVGDFRHAEASFKSVTAQLKAAQAVQKSIQQGITSTASSLEGSYSIIPPTTNAAGQNVPVTHASILANLEQSVAQLKAFRFVIQKLKREGLSEDILAQLVQAGPAAALPTADQLANDPTLIKKANWLQTEVNRNSETIAKLTTVSTYNGQQVGISTINGIVSGLQSQKSRVSEELMKLAREMRKAIEKALGIHSPSRVFHDYGVMVVQGLINGIIEQTGKASAAAKGLAQSVASGGAVGGLAASGTPRSQVFAPAGAGNVIYQITAPITVNGAKDAKTTAEEIRKELLQLVRSRRNVWGPWAGS